MTLRTSILFCLFILTLVSCDKKRIFDEYQKVGQHWAKDSIITFKFENNDTIAYRDLFLNLRCDDNYPFNNIFLILKMEAPDGFTRVDTMEYQMAKPDGTLLGDGFTDLKESKLYYRENFKFSKIGTYQFSVQQAVRAIGKVNGVEKLEGIKDIGFRIESK